MENCTKFLYKLALKLDKKISINDIKDIRLGSEENRSNVLDETKHITSEGTESACIFNARGDVTLPCTRYNHTLDNTEERHIDTLLNKLVLDDGVNKSSLFLRFEDYTEVNMCFCECFFDSETILHRLKLCLYNIKLDEDHSLVYAELKRTNWPRLKNVQIPLFNIYYALMSKYSFYCHSILLDCKNNYKVHYLRGVILKILNIVENYTLFSAQELCDYRLFTKTNKERLAEPLFSTINSSAYKETNGLIKTLAFKYYVYMPKTFSKTGYHNLRELVGSLTCEQLEQGFDHIRHNRIVRVFWHHKINKVELDANRYNRTYKDIIDMSIISDEDLRVESFFHLTQPAEILTFLQFNQFIYNLKLHKVLAKYFARFLSQNAKHHDQNTLWQLCKENMHGTENGSSCRCKNCFNMNYSCRKQLENIDANHTCKMLLYNTLQRYTKETTSLDDFYDTIISSFIVPACRSKSLARRSLGSLLMQELIEHKKIDKRIYKPIIKRLIFDYNMDIRKTASIYIENDDFTSSEIINMLEAGTNYIVSGLSLYFMKHKEYTCEIRERFISKCRKIEEPLHGYISVFSIMEDYTCENIIQNVYKQCFEILSYDSSSCKVEDQRKKTVSLKAEVDDTSKSNQVIWMNFKECCVFFHNQIYATKLHKKIFMLVDGLLSINHLGSILTIGSLLNNIFATLDFEYKELLELCNIGLKYVHRCNSNFRKSGGISTLFVAIARNKRHSNKFVRHVFAKLLKILDLDKEVDSLYEKLMKDGDVPEESENNATVKSNNEEPASSSFILHLHALNILKSLIEDHRTFELLEDSMYMLFKIAMQCLKNSNWSIRNAGIAIFASLLTKNNKRTNKGIGGLFAQCGDLRRLFYRYFIMSINDGNRAIQYLMLHVYENVDFVTEQERIEIARLKYVGGIIELKARAILAHEQKISQNDTSKDKFCKEYLHKASNDLSSNQKCIEKTFIQLGSNNAEDRTKALSACNVLFNLHESSAEYAKYYIGKLIVDRMYVGEMLDLLERIENRVEDQIVDACGLELEQYDFDFDRTVLMHAKV